MVMIVLTLLKLKHNTSISKMTLEDIYSHFKYLEMTYDAIVTTNFTKTAISR